MRARRVLVPAAALIIALAAVAPPARGETDAMLARALGNLFRAETVRIDAVPDLYEGGYARISMYARRARVATGGPVIDEAWSRLRGVTLNMSDLRRGTFTVKGIRSNAIYLRVSLRSLEQYFAANDYEDIKLWSDGVVLYGTGRVPVFNNRKTRVEMKGSFAVEGTKDLFFHVESLRVSGFPVPEGVLRWLEKKFNPILSQQDWPVIYTFRSVRLTTEGVIVSSESDPTVCSFCADVRP